MKAFSKFTLAAVALGASLALAPALRADSFDFTYTFGSTTIDGELIATSLGGGSYLVTGGSMTWGNITAGIFLGGPTAVYSPSGAFLFDNILFNPSQNGSFLDVDGLLFMDANGDEFNFWGNGGVGNDTFYDWLKTPGGYDTELNGGTFTITPVPEPGTWLLLGSGLLGLGIVAIRRTRRPINTV